MCIVLLLNLGLSYRTMGSQRLQVRDGMLRKGHQK